jgi:16S rRNA (cytosine967-C5)-methyltransferase
MTPAARLQHVIDILGALAATDQPADRLIREWFRARRYAGSKDRAAIAERVFGVLRHRAELAWRMQDDAPRALVLAAVAQAGEDPDTLFTGQAYAPQAVTDAERKALKAPRDEAPLHVLGEFPAFLEPELTRRFGDQVLREMAALQARAPVDLRVNTIRRARDEVLAALVAQGYAATATPYAQDGIRIASGEGSAQLGRGPMFESGAFEFQDEAAQICAMLCAARPDQRILDLAAGAGGKTLALAAAMRNQSEIVACDVRQPALQELAVRATRAGAKNIRTHLLDDRAPLTGTFDTVLLDAPCSGSGTWRRQPELRWRTTPTRLSELVPLQDKLLVQAATHVRPGGRLVYATCSILPRENEERVETFLRRNPAFARLSAVDIWARETGEAPPPGMAQDFRATPHTTGTDGFYTAILIHKAAPSGALDRERA